MTFYIILYGRGGELSRRSVESEPEINAAIMDLLQEAPLTDGDTIRVVSEDQ